MLRFTDIRWTNSPRKMIVDWEHEYAIRDIDGTFTQTGEETYVIPNSGTFDPAKCSSTWPNEPTAVSIGNPQPVLCFHDNGNFKPHRFAFNKPSPPSLEGTTAVLTSQFGTGTTPFRACRPMPKGWMVMLDGKQMHNLHFVGYEHVTNISYTGHMSDLEKGEWSTIQHEFYQRIDYTDFETQLDQMVDPANSSHTNLAYYLSGTTSFNSESESPTLSAWQLRAQTALKSIF